MECVIVEPQPYPSIFLLDSADEPCLRWSNLKGGPARLTGWPAHNSASHHTPLSGAGARKVSPASMKAGRDDGIVAFGEKALQPI